MGSNNPIIISKLHVLLNILAPLVDGFSQDFYNRDSSDEIIEMRGNNHKLTSKLHVLFKISLIHVDGFSKDFYNRDSLMRDQIRGNNPMLTSKLHVLLNILDPCEMDSFDFEMRGKTLL